MRAHPETGSELSRKAGAGEMTCVVRKKLWTTGPACETAICSCQTYFVAHWGSAQGQKRGVATFHSPGGSL